MNKFRTVGWYDELIKCVCLKCKNGFDCSDTGTIRFCPLCGVKFDGQFTTVNKRYKLKYPKQPNTKTENRLIVWSDIPILVLENGTLVDKEFSREGFRYRYIKPYIQWYSWMNRELNICGQSTAIEVYSTFKSLNNDYARIVMVNKDGRHIIKERIKELPDNSKMITGRYISSFVASGVSAERYDFWFDN